MSPAFLVAISIGIVAPFIIIAPRLEFRVRPLGCFELKIHFVSSRKEDNLKVEL
ncbi:MAG: hypothetical protein P9X24_02320 [Candidatus Hatepunaea meridiana]|nr:hypothetical protein [Candidatus Hatepunaea meridiana]